MQAQKKRTHSKNIEPPDVMPCIQRATIRSCGAFLELSGLGIYFLT